MTTGAKVGCSHCDTEAATNHYHGPGLKRIPLCRTCYDQYVAKEMVAYWKDHIAEEERRAGTSS